MTLSVPNDLQYALLEFIAHINVEDFESLPKDFVNLGFSPSDKLEQLENSGITEGLSLSSSSSSSSSLSLLKGYHSLFDN